MSLRINLVNHVDDLSSTINEETLSHNPHILAPHELFEPP